MKGCFVWGFFFLVSALDPAPVLGGMDEDMSFCLPPVLAESKEEEVEESAPRPQPRRQVCRPPPQKQLKLYWPFFLCSDVSDDRALQGNKRRAVEQSSARVTSEGSSVKPSLPLKARYGVHAWKRWALSSSEKTEDAKLEDGSKPGKIPTQLDRYLTTCRNKQ